MWAVSQTGHHVAQLSGIKNTQSQIRLFPDPTQIPAFLDLTQKLEDTRKEIELCNEKLEEMIGRSKQSKAETKLLKEQWDKEKKRQ